MEIGSVTLDALYDLGCTRTFVTNEVGQKFLESTEKEMDRSHKSMMIVANGSMQVIERKFKLPLPCDKLSGGLLTT